MIRATIDTKVLTNFPRDVSLDATAQTGGRSERKGA